MKKLFIILIMLLSACATKPDIVVPPGAVKSIILDARVFELCDKLDKLPKTATFEDVLNIISANVQAYGICADKQRVSVELLKQLSNKKDK